MKKTTKAFRKILGVLLSVCICFGYVALVGNINPKADAATAGQYPYKITAAVYDNLTIDPSINYVLYGITDNGTGSEVKIDEAKWDGKSVSTGSTYTIMEGTTLAGVFPSKLTLDDDGVKYYAVCSVGFNITIEVNGVPVNMTGSIISEDVGNGKIDVGSGTAANFYWKTHTVAKTNKFSVKYDVTDRPAPAEVIISGGNEVVSAAATGAANNYSDTFTATVYDQYGVQWAASAPTWSVAPVDNINLSFSSATGDTTKLVLPAFTANSTRKETLVTAKCTYGSISAQTDVTVAINPTYRVVYDANGGQFASGAKLTDTKLNTSSTRLTVPYYVPESNFAISRTGYDFFGWATSPTANSGVSSTSTISQINYDNTFYAIWSGHVYYIRCNSNNAAAKSVNYAATYGIEMTLPANTFTDSYKVTYVTNNGEKVADTVTSGTFLGWAETKRGAVVYADGGKVINLATENGEIADIYAVWNHETIKLPSIAKQGYSFAGWYSDAAFKTRVGGLGDNYTPTNDITLYAKWTCNHDEYVSSIIDAPTCTASGKTAYVCTNCGDTYTVTTDPIDHSYGSWIYSKATDTHSKICANDPTHVITENCTYNRTVTADATCAAEGSAIVICSVCGGGYTETIGKIEHTPSEPVKEITKGSTCVKEGTYNEVVYCAECNAVLSKVAGVLELKEHTLVTINAIEATDCQTEGFTAGARCTVCHATITAPVSTGYGPHKLTEKAEVPATCIAKGTTAGTTCDVCGYIEEGCEEIALADHNPGAPVYENIKGAPCSATSTYNEVVYCTVCDAKLSSTAKTGATAEHVIVKIPAVTASNCLTEGFTEGEKCSVCSKIFTAPVSTGIGEHSVKVIKAVTATCTTEGYTGDKMCTFCGVTVEKGEVVEKLPHTRVTAPGFASTCISHGQSDAVVCLECSAVLEAPQELPFAAHTTGTTRKVNYVTGSCSVQSSYDEVTYCSFCNGEMARTTVYTGYAAHTPGAAVTENEKAGTCVKYGTIDEVVYCTVCNAEVSRTVKNTVLGAHNYKDTTDPATCANEGTLTHTCTVCGQHYNDVIPATGKHSDATGDGICDTCGKDLTTNCSHMCHQSGFMGFIWKIMNIFNKMFGSSKYCSCGKAHY